MSMEGAALILEGEPLQLLKLLQDLEAERAKGGQVTGGRLAGAIMAGLKFAEEAVKQKTRADEAEARVRELEAGQGLLALRLEPWGEGFLRTKTNTQTP